MPPCFSFLLHLVQVWIVGEKVGEGIGRTRREAQHKAAEMSLRNLASKFVLLHLTV
jgi:dsRNA-specific ribonuclease